MSAFTPLEFAARRERARAMLQRLDLELAIFTQNADLYYFTGSVQPLYLVMPAVGEPFILARKALTRLADEVCDVPVLPFTGSRELTAAFAPYADARKVGFTLDTVAYATVARLLRFFPTAEPFDLAWEARLLRACKSPAELDVVTRAGALMASISDTVRATFRPGMTELELSAALEHDFRLRGHTALIRCRREGMEMSGLGICVAGVNSLGGTKFEGISGGIGLSPAVPYGATHDLIRPGVPILIDFAFSLEGYHCDQTRMCCWGTPDPAVSDAFTTMLAVEDHLLAAMRPGVTWEALYQQSVDDATARGYADTFMGAGTEKVKFVGHGVGLELDEPPLLAPGMPYPLEPGMVIAIEPKVALPGVGVVGVEDTVAITETGCTRLTHGDRAMILLPGR